MVICSSQRSAVAQPLTLQEYLEFDDGVVEVVSPRQESRDYRHKRTEYAGRHIPEYWIVDAMAGKVTILPWVDGLYKDQVYEGEVAIASPLFPDIDLTAATILAAGRG